MKRALLIFIISLHVSAADYININWKSCNKDSDCHVILDMGCMNQCKTGVLNIKHKNKLTQKINKDCADVFMPALSCAKDLRPKVSRCRDNKCVLMTKHICCTSLSKQESKAYNCHIKKVSCKEHPFK